MLLGMKILLLLPLCKAKFVQERRILNLDVSFKQPRSNVLNNSVVRESLLNLHVNFVFAPAEQKSTVIFWGND